jgi:lipopolysaccharide export LptBFGC system permease protein LptF
MTAGTSPVAGSQRIKQGKASLIGGIAVGVATFVLWNAVAHELAADSPLAIIAGALVAVGIATWIRVADL